MSAVLKSIYNMAILPDDPAYISPREYLTIERGSEEKHEYYEGEVVTMNGASLAHNDIVANLIGELVYYLKSSPCRPLPSSMRVCNPSAETYMYPDVVIVCGKPQLEDGNFDSLKNPSVIFEVLSPSTEKNDRGRKFYFYKQIPSLQEYILIDSNRQLIEIFRKQADASWHKESIIDPADFLNISTVNLRLPMKEVYRNVDFSEDSPG